MGGCSGHQGQGSRDRGQWTKGAYQEGVRQDCDGEHARKRIRVHGEARPARDEAHAGNGIQGRSPGTGPGMEPQNERAQHARPNEKEKEIIEIIEMMKKTKRKKKEKRRTKHD